eukprot:PhF_6_TR30116/c2_g1_i2/m.43990
MKTVLQSIGICFGVIIIVLGIIGYVYIPMIVKARLDDAVQIPRSGDAFEDWKNMSRNVPTYIGYFAYNITNPTEIEAGAIPNLVEVGPFVYQKVVVLIDTLWNDDNGTVQYKKRGESYTFIPSKSIDRKTGRQLYESDTLVMVDIAMQSLMDAAQYGCMTGDPTLWGALPFVAQLTGSKVFQTKTFYQYFFGYNSSLLGALKLPATVGIVKPPRDVYPSEVITGTGIGVNGRSARDSTSWITMFQGSRTLPYWKTAAANKLGGYTGSFPRPLEDTILVWVDTLFRNLTFIRSKDVDMHTVDVKRYIVDVSLAGPNPDFYQRTKGFFPLPPAAQSPIIYSIVHFGSNVDLSAVKVSIDGQNPPKYNEDEHGVYLDVEPYTGKTFRVANRVQVNVYLQPRVCNSTLTLSLGQNIAPTYFPIFWAEETTELPEDKCRAFASLVYGTFALSYGLGVAALVLGSLCVVGVSGTCFISASATTTAKDGKQEMVVVVAPAVSVSKAGGEKDTTAGETVSVVPVEGTN